MKNIALTLTISIGLVAPAVFAQAYRCEGPDGRMSFQARPCAGTTSEKVEIYVPPAPSQPQQSTRSQQENSEYWENLRQERLEREAVSRARSQAIRAENEKQERFRLMMMRNQIAVGMTQDQVRRSWGSPCRTSTTTRENSVSVQWVYCRRDTRDDYVHFYNGIVSSITR